MEGKVVGFSVAKILKKDRLGKLVSKSDIKSEEVTSLYVDAHYRGNNIGAMLMVKTESFLKKQGCMHIGIRIFWPNKNAHGFYKKLGYELYNATYIKEI
jgi:ribosomal protein S18 acetylase RimI-like enzyme